ncbi:PAS domain-containing protein [Bosea sp. TND4EK4]|uniref:PAS domain-containing protein n=1 Tax=Bosea sp. TND4EK4 TaxID=1907408 RepID=UPI000970E164|nr:PAS domain-containing protein [Bosea sp. TND4EK4]
MSASDEHARIDAEIDRVEKSSDPFAAAVRATRMPMLITNPNKPDNPIVFANEAFLRLTGYSRAEVLGRNCRFLQGPETDPADIARLRDAIRRRAQIEMEIINHRKDGSKFWNRVLISPVFDKDGRLTYFFASQLDVTLERDRLVRLEKDRDALDVALDRRTTDLRLSEERMRFILTGARLGSWTLTFPDLLLTCSDISRRHFGLLPNEPFSYDDMKAAVVESDRLRLEAAIADGRDEATELELEFRTRTPAGETRWLMARARPHVDADDVVTGMSGIMIDLTDSKRNEEQRHILTAELKHRVKNAMATVQSIVTQSLRNAVSIGEARDVISARLQSLSAAHDLLTRENWNSATIPEIVTAATAPFDIPKGARFSIHGLDLRMPPRATLALVLAFHELATNAVRYGALSVPSGHVVVDWDVVKHASDDMLELRWHEFGGPPVAGPPARRRFGTRLIEAVLAAELNGKAAIDFRPSGLVFKIVAPVPDQDKIAATAEDEEIFRRHLASE